MDLCCYSWMVLCCARTMLVAFGTEFGCPLVIRVGLGCKGRSWSMNWCVKTSDRVYERGSLSACCGCVCAPRSMGSVVLCGAWMTL
jgi:hypothetical protein